MVFHGHSRGELPDSSPGLVGSTFLLLFPPADTTHHLPCRKGISRPTPFPTVSKVSAEIQYGCATFSLREPLLGKHAVTASSGHFQATQAKRDTFNFLSTSPLQLESGTPAFISPTRYNNFIILFTNREPKPSCKLPNSKLQIII